MNVSSYKRNMLTLATPNDFLLANAFKIYAYELGLKNWRLFPLEPP